MNLLARCFEEGWGIRRDPSAAARWYLQSAHGGYFRAQFNHGTILAAQGRIDEALGWFDKALREAPPDSLRAMVQVLLRHNDRRVVAFAHLEAARLMERRGRHEGAQS
jgi:TPR repeat protein